eukprot:8250960-Alexandrium_andersonii.AAC.1
MSASLVGSEMCIRASLMGRCTPGEGGRGRGLFGRRRCGGKSRGKVGLLFGAAGGLRSGVRGRRERPEGAGGGGPS